MNALRRNIAICVSIAALTLAAVIAVVPSSVLAQTDGRAVADAAPVGGQVPGQSLGGSSDADIWRAVRRGLQGNVSIPNKQAGIMIQSEGDNWRAWRNGPLTVASAWILLGMLGLLALFFAVRGRVKIESGTSGKTVERFNGIERFAHWMTAVSFVLLALTGLNLLFGRHILIPVFGKDVFAALTMGGKYVHDYVSFAFMIGIVLMFVLWIRHNLPTRHDLAWLAKGGGLFAKGVHPPAEKFNAGQKVIFWSVVLGGSSLSVTGIALLFPFQLSLFAGTFEALNVFGASLPTALTPIQEMQYAQLWHAIVGAIMIAIILAHIYIGSLGMEGAFAAMGSGQVDRNWAREHHNLWYAKLTGGSGSGHRQQPAE